MLLGHLARYGLLLGLATCTFAVTSGATVNTSKAGDGSGTVSGYTASSILYNLNASSPQNIDSVTMTLSAAPKAGSTIKVRLVAGGSWYTCTNVTTALTCVTTAPQATAATANGNNLTVVVAD